MKSSLGQHFCFLLGVYCTKDTQEEGALEMVGGGQAYTPQVASSTVSYTHLTLPTTPYV